MFRLPDLYDIDGSSAGVGDWSVMGTGSWCGPGGNGAKPCHHDPWSKMALGWLTPTVITAAQSGISLPALDQNASALLVPIDPYQDGEYLLVANRYARNTGVAGTGFDQYLPGSGALVMHVDDYITRNSIESHKKVDVEEADGLGQLDSNANRGNSGDLYPNGGISLTDATNPNAKDYEGNNTGITIGSFTGAGTATMTCAVTPRTLSGSYIAYDTVGATGEGLGWADGGDDYGLVVFTTATTGTLRRVKTFFKHSGMTTYTVNVYSGWDSGSRLPTGLLTTEAGTVSTSGPKEILLSSPQQIPAGSTFCIEIRYDTAGGDSFPVPIANDGAWSGRSYARSTSGFSYYQLTPATGYPQDVNIRADVPVTLSHFKIE